MKTYRVTIKLINVTHEEFENYKIGFCSKYKCNMEKIKDTYICYVTQEGYKDLEQVREVFAINNKIIFLNKGNI